MKRYRIMQLSHDGKALYWSAELGYIANAMLASFLDDANSAFAEADEHWDRNSRGIQGYYVERIPA